MTKEAPDDYTVWLKLSPAPDLQELIRARSRDMLTAPRPG
jgi:hypothetical protein